MAFSLYELAENPGVKSKIKSYQPSTGEPFPESNQGTVELVLRNGTRETVVNANSQNCQMWDVLKERADQCGMGDESKFWD